MKQTIVALFLIATSILCVVAAPRSHNAGLSSALTESDLNDIRSAVLSHTGKDWPNNIHNAYFVTGAIEADKVPKQSEVANLAKNILKGKDTQSVESIYHAVRVVKNLKIGDATVDKAVVDKLKKTIDDGNTLAELYYAGMAAISLRELKLTKDITDDDLSPLATKVADLADEDGTFRSSATSKDSSLYNSGLGLQLLAGLKKNVKLTEEDKEHVETVVELAESVVSLANEGDGTLEFSGADSANALATTSSILVGLTELAAANGKPLTGVTPAHITQIGQYLVNHKHVGTLSDAYYLLSGLHALQDNTISIPIVVSHERASIVGTAKGAEGHLRLRVTDVFDKPITGAKAFLIKAHPVGKDTHVLLSNQELTLSDDKNAYTLNFLAAKPDQGFYSLEYRVVPSDKKYATVDSAVRTAKIVGTISISDLEITVADSKEALNKASEGSRYQAADQTKKIDEHIRIDPTQFVNVKFRVRSGAGTNKPVLVSQAFVKFTNAKTGHEAIFVAQPNDNKLYSVVIGMDESAKQFKSASGDYKLEIVAGDSFIQNPIHWVPSSSVKITFLPTSAAGSHTHGPLPEIVHQFREAEKRPSLIVSNVFTLVVLAPLLFLFVGFISVGANISQFPFTGTEFINAVGFVGSIGAILGLMALYWLRLNLIQTLGYLAVLAIPTVFFGQRALSHIARRKEKAE